MSSKRPDAQQRRSSAPSHEMKKLPLSEKTSSTLNTFNSKSRSNGLGKINDSSPTPVKAPKRGGTKASVRSLPQDTIQHKPSQLSPLKAHVENGTPEWKRRLKNHTGSGDQQDLFSPIGLESVFRPPTVKNKGEKKKGPRYQPVAANDIPSSPPPLPSRLRKMSEKLGDEEPHEKEEVLKYSNNSIDESEEDTEGNAKEGQPPNEPQLDDKRRVKQPLQRPVQKPRGVPQRQTDDPQSPRMTPRLPSYDHNTRSGSSTSQTSQNHKASPMDSDHVPPSERSRVTSGQTEDCDEKFSPYFVSRQHTVDGRVDYTPVKNMNEFLKMMGEPKHEHEQIPTSPASDNGISYARAHSSTVSLDAKIPDSDNTSHSLPENLSHGTESFVANGGFVNSRRGGRSQEGSFLRRSLSPPSSPSSALVGFDAPGPPEPSQIQVQDEEALNLAEPATPGRQTEGDANSSERPRSSGSPLKLFDKYDTFTNDRLQRRMSKFEETVPESIDDGSAFDQSRIDDEQLGERKKSITLFGRSTNSGGSRVSSFGDGQLNDHPFESFPSPPFNRERQKYLDRPNQKPGDFRFIRASEEELARLSESERNVLASGSGEAQVAEQYEDKFEEDVTHTANGKRLPCSPAKDPKRKRRRTLGSSEEAEMVSLHTRKESTSSPAPTSSILGRKRKDALYDGGVQVADPNVLAMRQILRPRNPTPSQHPSCRDSSSKESISTSGQTLQHPPDPKYTGTRGSREALNPPTEKLAGEIASLASDMVKELSGSTRKPSVNTADFFNEAQQIMQLIRSRARPVSEDITEEEPAADLEEEYEDSLYPESTKEEFSRPPSREGGSLRRLRQPAKLDARIVSQLRKYEEKTDVGMTLSSSLKSLKMGLPNDTAMTIELKDIARQQDQDMESDPNIRIIERKRGNSSSETVVPALTNGIQPSSVGSHSTSGPSTGQSIPTNSSRGSRNKAVIAPETVAHLLSDQVAGMTFDHEKQVWVKSRSSSKAAGEDMRFDANDEITEDELGGIPDLSVDEIEELRRIKMIGPPRKTIASMSGHVADLEHAEASQEVPTGSEQPAGLSSRPQTADGTQTNTHDASSAPSKLSRFASTGPMPETRATSWGDEESRRKAEQSQAPDRSWHFQHTEDGHAEEVEHEISILEGRVSITPRHTTHRQPRAVTVTFSSPLVDHIEASYFRSEESALQEERSALDPDDSPVRKASNTRVASVARRTSGGFGRKSAYRSSSRRMSVGNQSYIARPMSRLDEQDEMSMVHIPHAVSLNLAASTPLPTRSQALIVPTAGLESTSVTFQLSPLPDFTVHQVDRSLDQNNATEPLLSERSVSQATQEMVKKLTDVEPYEPYWDYLRAIDLHERNIASLHMLRDFCGRLEELDVSNNELRELTGAPSTLRHLRIRHNCLSNLTAWNHLHNLQYLDVSGNQLRNLNGFQSLVHLRELRVDNNQIEDIQGVLGLDGLLRLSVRGNQLEKVDFENSDITRLTDLDLRGNKLVKVSGLHQLRALQHLHLGNNKLSDFAPSLSLPHLETLDLASNSLSTINLNPLPNLRTLNIDQNSISHLPSLSTLRQLHTLSWRSQSLSPGSEIHHESCHNLTNLYLSGNTLSSFTFHPDTAPFFNLQVLELASTGLQTLPEDFGLQCPNLRTLNLNFNAIRDLRPLLGIARLERLYLAGNRIERLRRTAAVLERVGKGLREVDMRACPLTVGFYVPPSQSQSPDDDKRLILSDSNPSDNWTEEKKAFLLPL
ncbi:hypothetical protein G7Y79_00014g036490 [Physcia stellaris]|nr:hypothetical protein G7Y79_00014g036490 [Physcia stellaris]